MRRRWWCVLFLSLVLGCSSDPGHSGGDAGDNQPGPDAEQPGPDADLPAEERPSGQVAEVRDGEPLVVDQARRQDARQAYESLDKDELEAGFSPEELYEIFNEFVITHHGPANQPLIEEFTGALLDFRPDGEWRHVSRNSAALAFETTRPTRTFIEYGASEDSLTEATEETERYFFHHLHHLRGLEADATYYYRLVARQDDGEAIVSHVESFTTESGPFVEIPGELAGPPFVLAEPGEYLLTEDIEAEGTAIVVEGSGITLDLNGHRITYGAASLSSVNPNDADEAASGIWGRTRLEDLRILNGELREGHVGNASTSNGGLNPIYLSGAENLEIAGVDAAYHAAQINAVFVRYPRGELRIHHNRLTDRGFEVLDRHGSGGGRPLRIIANDPDPGEVDDFHVTHNLVPRTRQNGLNRAQRMEANEIYVDSWATNSFAMQPFSRNDHVAGTLRRNKLFLTGYNAIGFGWAHLDLLIAENLVVMEGVSTGDNRYYESWGELDSTSAFRITNYGSGGQVRNNLVYRDNVVLGRARGGGVMRGTMFFTDESIEDTLFEGNLVIVDDEDGESLDTTPVVGQGVYANREGHQPAYYVDNHIASNVANIRFGDSYGRGDRHVFIRPILERRGDHPGYHTFVFDAGFDSNRHEIIDPVFLGGAAFDDVWWRRTSVVSYYTIRYTLTVTGPAGESLVIRDVDDQEVFSGELDEDGRAEVVLSAVTIRPAEWEEGTNTFEVQERTSHQEIWHTPHEVTVGGETRTVEVVDGPETLEF